MSTNITGGRCNFYVGINVNYGLQIMQIQCFRPEVFPFLTSKGFSDRIDATLYIIFPANQICEFSWLSLSPAVYIEHYISYLYYNYINKYDFMIIQILLSAQKERVWILKMSDFFFDFFLFISKKPDKMQHCGQECFWSLLQPGNICFSLIFERRHVSKGHIAHTWLQSKDSHL